MPKLQPSFDASRLQLVRMLKPLRLFKLFRLLRASRILQVLDKVEEVLRPPAAVMGLFRLLLVISFVVHSCACFYWLAKEMYSTEEEYIDFLERQNLPADAGLMPRYALAVYFTNTMFTTVGFGDVSAENTEERWFSTLIMYVGCIVFGILLSEVQTIIAQYNQLELRRTRLLQQIKEFLRSNKTPATLERKILQWVSFDFEVKQRKETEDIALSHIPAELRRSLVAHLHKDLLFSVTFLRTLRSLRREDFLVDLFACMEPVTFCKHLPVATKDHQASKLLAITHGFVKMVLYDGVVISTLNPGDIIGEASLLGDDTYRTPHGLPCEFFALSYVTCLALTRSDFDVILECYDNGLKKEIKAARAQWAIRRRSQERWLRALTSENRDAHVMEREMILMGRWVSLISKLRARIGAGEQGDSASGMSIMRTAQRMKLSVKGGWAHEHAAESSESEGEADQADFLGKMVGSRKDPRAAELASHFTVLSSAQNLLEKKRVGGFQPDDQPDPVDALKSSVRD